jgi:hypothetical protein
MFQKRCFETRHECEEKPQLIVFADFNYGVLAPGLVAGFTAFFTSGRNALRG